MINNIYTQQPNYLWGSITLSGYSSSLSALNTVGGSSDIHLVPDIEPPKSTTIGYLTIGNQEISFDKKPTKFQLFIFKKLGFEWNDEYEFPHPEREITEEELINQRRYEILDEILNKNIFYRLKQKIKNYYEYITNKRKY